MESKKVIGAVIGVIAFVAVIAGATFAWLQWSTATPTTITGSTDCFTIVYDKGTDISGTLAMATSYDEVGKTANAEISINIDPSCGIDGTADIYLTTTQIGYTGTFTTGFKYQLVSVVGETETPVAGGDGAIAGTGKITLLEDLDLTTSAQVFKLYIWLDGNEATNDSIGATYAGYISADAVQVNN